MSSVASYIYDDGSTVSANGYSSTPALDERTMAVNNSGTQGTGNFDALNGFVGLLTQVGGTVSTLTAQRDAIAANEAARALAKQKQDAALQIGSLNAQREVAVASINAQAMRFFASPLGLLSLAGAIGLVLWAAHRKS